ncbi:MAG: hypothetical protein IPN42_07715 [Methylococcaceae bacterium]|nr:hypothetical protein [Methylococcaceae bacterium]
MPTWICKRLGCLIFVFSCCLYGKEPQVLIVYPQVEEPLKSIYASVITGIGHKISHTKQLELPEGTTDTQSELALYHPDKIIALGKRVADTLIKSQYRQQIFIGMVYANPSGTAGVSLALESQAFANRLAQLCPVITRVFVVQENTHSAITHNPVDSASTPKIIIREGEDMIATIRILGHLVEQEATSGDAVMVPANLPDNIFYEIAKIAWDRKITLLSNNLAHLEGGVLMVFYPDEVGLGEQLGTLANTDKTDFENLKSVNVGLNQRVAQHLNMAIEPAKLAQFSVTLK